MRILEVRLGLLSVLAFDIRSVIDEFGPALQFSPCRCGRPLSPRQWLPASIGLGQVVHTRQGSQMYTEAQHQEALGLDKQ